MSPIDGSTYPIVDVTPPGTVHSAYITASFGTTCAGGEFQVEWGSDGTAVGQGRFYDQMSVQLVQKLPAGTHTFGVALWKGRSEASRCRSQRCPSRCFASLNMTLKYKETSLTK